MHVLLIFILAVLTFPYWYVFIGMPALALATVWIIGYPIACTVHMLYVRVRRGYWPPWQLLYPGR